MPSLLGSKRNDAYEAALAALREDTQQWWADVLARDPDELEEDEEPATADAEGLRRFIEGDVLPWFENRKKELANRPLIREQAFGEALDADKLERLDATRSISTASWSACSPCCCASRTCGGGPPRADSVWQNGRARVLPGRCHAGVPSAGSRQPDRRRPPKLNPAGLRGSSQAEILCGRARRGG